MVTGTQIETNQEDKPLTRTDVEQLLKEAGSPDKLDLSGKNMRDIDLSHFDLTGANLKSAKLIMADLGNTTLKKASLKEALLRGADLTEADLRGADLSNADLSQANLRRLDLSKINLQGADLDFAKLDEANLKGLDLRGCRMREASFNNADLSRANLSEVQANGSSFLAANFSRANLSGASLRRTSLERANLLGANLRGVMLAQADLTNASISPRNEEDILHGMGINWSSEAIAIEDIRGQSSVIRIRITEEPLTAHNLTAIFSALTELHTKCWLIAKGRFSDLIEYMQTRNIQFEEEANLVITKLRHNSPAELELTQGKSTDTKSKSDSPINVDVKVEASPQGVMEALGVAIDGVVQAPLRYKEKKLELQAQAHGIKQAEQKASQESQMALLEKEKQELKNERKRLGLIEKRLEIQKKGIEYALEIANKMVDALYPNANAEAKAMLTRTLLPNILQLDNVKGLELVLPAPQSSKEETETTQNG